MFGRLAADNPPHLVKRVPETVLLPHESNEVVKYGERSTTNDSQCAILQTSLRTRADKPALARLDQTPPGRGRNGGWDNRGKRKREKLNVHAHTSNIIASLSSSRQCFESFAGPLTLCHHAMLHQRRHFQCHVGRGTV
ncbi:hypothetical protein VTH06DRAFT_6664 [Thermothelomyces fergusii]